MRLYHMFSVPDGALIIIDINQEADTRYKRLLQNQYRALKADLNAIEKTARGLRTLILTADSELREYDRQVKARCCNLALLESVYAEYELSEKVLITER
ncbi:MAG: type III toxin-antitoxin system ToxN/AbiQ family toxin [Oscillospiraceae bacterium]|nr:type III toxin-antitoxin system ToxN/AbiQ family toxin [Oscillospiraceae bacterium]